MIPACKPRFRKPLDPLDEPLDTSRFPDPLSEPNKYYDPFIEREDMQNDL